VLLVTGLLLVASAFGAWATGSSEAAAGAPLKITADYIWRNSPPPATDRRVMDYYNSVIVQRTGVDATWQNSALTGKTGPQLISEWTAAGTMPEVVQYAALIQETTWSTPWVEQRLSWTWDVTKVKQYLPGYVARLAKYGVKIEDVLPFNKFKDENWYIPMGFNFAQFPSLSTMEEAKAVGINYYAVGLRDDVLKRIYPAAKTEAELQQVFAKNGKLTIQDVVGDIPLKNLEDLYQYMRKVKALNMKVGDKPLIPGALSAQSEALGSIDWSLRTIIGYHWQWPIIYQNEPSFQGSFFLRNGADYGEYLRWWNKLYNEGLMDPEIFVMKNDQYFAKATNGEYAVVNFWAPINDARRVGKERGYGFRYLPLFYGQLKQIYNNQWGYRSLQASPLMITTKVTQENLAKVMKWVDWYMSEERDELAFWGSPDMYTGTAKNRRYKPEFKEVEDWAVYGVQSAKDGVYYGLQHTYSLPTNEYQTVKLPIGGINFFGMNFTYPDGPNYVYQKDPAKLAALQDIWNVSADTVVRAAYDEVKLWTYANGPNNEIRNLPAMTGWDQYQADHGAEMSATIVKMVTGPVADFNTNWANYQRMWKEAGTGELEAQAATWMADYYKNVVLPKQIK